MTSLVAWTGVDSRAPASFYFASDSRISASSDLKWDCARKVFASSRYPDILGYCGNVLFTSQLIAQIVNVIDVAAVFEGILDAESKFGLIAATVKRAHANYPFAIPGRPEFTIIHGSRRGCDMQTSYALFELTWKKNEGWTEREISAPSKSEVVAVYGSGTNFLSGSFARWRKSDIGGTSRSVFSAFCDSLEAKGDPFSGGPPQIVGLFRRGCAESFGVIYRGQAYLGGLPMAELPNLDGVEWRNELFERCDWRTKQRLKSAHPHARPRQVPKPS
jgi:hypothetical protein